jgi:hypothetical protein
MPNLRQEVDLFDEDERIMVGEGFIEVLPSNFVLVEIN